MIDVTLSGIRYALQLYASYSILLIHIGTCQGGLVKAYYLPDVCITQVGGKYFVTAGMSGLRAVEKLRFVLGKCSPAMVGERFAYRREIIFFPGEETLPERLSDQTYVAPSQLRIIIFTHDLQGDGERFGISIHCDLVTSEEIELMALGWREIV